MGSMVSHRRLSYFQHHRVLCIGGGCHTALRGCTNRELACTVNNGLEGQLLSGYASRHNQGLCHKGALTEPVIHKFHTLCVSC